jgi:hypothetical protein
MFLGGTIERIPRERVGMAKKKMSTKDQAWAEAKHLCRLNADDIEKAKQLGMSPKSLMKNIPSKDQQWKAPVKDWVRDLHEKRFGKSSGRKGPSREKTMAEIIPFETVGSPETQYMA